MKEERGRKIKNQRRAVSTDNSSKNVASLVKYRSKEKLTVHAGVAAAAAALLQRCVCLSAEKLPNDLGYIKGRSGAGGE